MSKLMHKQYRQQLKPYLPRPIRVKRIKMAFVGMYSNISLHTYVGRRDEMARLNNVLKLYHVSIDVMKDNRKLTINLNFNYDKL